MNWKNELHAYWQHHHHALIHDEESPIKEFKEKEAFERKKEQLMERGAAIVRASSKANITGRHRYDDREKISYVVHHSYLIKHGNNYYIEEQMEERAALFKDGRLIAESTQVLSTDSRDTLTNHLNILKDENIQDNIRFQYNRIEAVKYAERWWNSYNPQYRHFHVDCTNYVSQCLRAGGAPMRGYPNRSNGWWFQNDNWSYSWSVAHALRWYLGSSEQGLTAKEVDKVQQLEPGDVICYDFDGDGKWQHTTFVVAKDDNGMPLVNAHTTNSRMRYWAYEDSTAWTNNIQYKFFHINA